MSNVALQIAVIVLLILLNGFFAMSETALVSSRKARLRQRGMSVDANYGLKDQVKAELEYAKSIFAQHAGWPVIDVTRGAADLPTYERRVRCSSSYAAWASTWWRSGSR